MIESENAMKKPSKTSYHWTLSLLHWVMVGLLAWLIWGGLALEGLGFSEAAGKAYAQHKVWGLAALMIASLRLCLRLCFRGPRLEPGWRGAASLWVQRALYMLLFAYPLSGYFFHAASRLKAPILIGGWQVPDWPLGPAAFWQDVHHACLISLGFVLCLHLSGAIWHLIQRDGFFRRILPL